MGHVAAQQLVRWDLTAFDHQALELRSGAPRYNFLGGKRDSEDETPWVVAAREAHEETGGLLSASARRNRWAYHTMVHALRALQAWRCGPLVPGAARRACGACRAPGWRADARQQPADGGPP
jgi:hypothetical protein